MKWDHQTILWKYQQKNIRNTKVVYQHEESLVLLLDSPLEHQTCASNSFVALPRLHATAVDCAHELINGESGVNGEAGKILQN